jgi:hypothetical protein
MMMMGMSIGPVMALLLVVVVVELLLRLLPEEQQEVGVRERKRERKRCCSMKGKATSRVVVSAPPSGPLPPAVVDEDAVLLNERLSLTFKCVVLHSNSIANDSQRPLAVRGGGCAGAVGHDSLRAINFENRTASDRHRPWTRWCWLCACHSDGEALHQTCARSLQRWSRLRRWSTHETCTRLQQQL